MRQQAAVADDAALGPGVGVEEVFQLPDRGDSRLAPPGDEDGDIQAGERIGNVEVQPPADEGSGGILATFLMRGGMIILHHIWCDLGWVLVRFALEEATQSRHRSEAIEDAIANYRT